MKIIVASVLNGALVFATAAGLLALSAGFPIQGWMLAACGPSFIMAVSCSFVAIGGLDALRAGQQRDAKLCGLLAVAWTVGLSATALFLISALLPAGWISRDVGKTLLLTGTLSHAALLFFLSREVFRISGRNLKL